MNNSESTPSTHRTNELLSELLTTIKKERPDDWLTITEAAQYSKLSEPTLRRYIKAGKLKVSKKTGRLLFKRSDIDRWLNG
jgi:excisionase family DNA binding protein